MQVWSTTDQQLSVPDLPPDVVHGLGFLPTSPTRDDETRRIDGSVHSVLGSHEMQYRPRHPGIKITFLLASNAERDCNKICGQFVTICLLNNVRVTMWPSDGKVSPPLTLIRATTLLEFLEIWKCRRILAKVRRKGQSRGKVRKRSGNLCR